MICTKCGLRPATTEIWQRHNDKTEKMFLCDECAKDFRPEVGLGDFGVLDNFMTGSPLSLLSGLNAFFGGEDRENEKLVCPNCHTTADEFLNTGFVGCPHCYEVFEPLVARTVKKIQQSDRHVGRQPIGYAPTGDEAARLNAELQDAVDKRDYARAAAISEQLNKLNSKEGE